EPNGYAGGAGIKIFCPTFKRFGFRSGFAFKIWSIVTLMFFSRYAFTITERVSLGSIVYSKPFCDDPPLSAGGASTVFVGVAFLEGATGAERLLPNLSSSAWILS